MESEPLTTIEFELDCYPFCTPYQIEYSYAEDDIPRGTAYGMGSPAVSDWDAIL